MVGLVTFCVAPEHSPKKVLFCGSGAKPLSRLPEHTIGGQCERVGTYRHSSICKAAAWNGS